MIRPQDLLKRSPQSSFSTNVFCFIIVDFLFHNNRAKAKLISTEVNKLEAGFEPNSYKK